MKPIKPLGRKDLYHNIDPAQFKFMTTEELDTSIEYVGQNRALDSVQFGIGIEGEGYNLFAMGSSGVGKRSFVSQVLQGEAIKQKRPQDWCYVNNFESPQKPIALELPAGSANKLHLDMEKLIEYLKNSIPIVFDSDEYRNRMQKVIEEMTKQQENLFKNIGEDAKKSGLVILSSPEGFTVLPIDENGEIIKSKEFAKLSDTEREEKMKLIATFSERLADFLKKLPKLHKARRKKEKEIKSEFTLAAVGQPLADIKEKYKKLPHVIDYLNSVEHDIIINIQDFIKREEMQPQGLTGNIEKNNFVRYTVNVLVDNSKTKGVPVIYEAHPSYANLISRVEHVAQFGTLFTDFTLIKSGSLHKANGGYLVLDARKILLQPFAWEGFKRALYTQKITIEPAERMLGLLSATSLEPMPIPLKIKVVLLGDRYIYHLLSEFDPDFAELFKVAVDFEERTDRTAISTQEYANLIATLVRKEGLNPFHRKAVAAVIDYCGRLAEDSKKLSTHHRSIKDILREANYWALNAEKEIVDAIHVKKAIENKTYRLDRIQKQLYEQIQRDIVFISLSGKMLSQINGLAVIEIGDFSFGFPTRITATVRFGHEGILDIQREAKLSGPIHSKAVLILSGYLAGKYVINDPLSLSASLVFEQNYGVIDGDSASVAELCALLSALSNTPINQSFAVTGSINQHGEIQAIGGVNEKIEGFYDVCKAKKLSHEQGVLIPKANIQHLMLREDVVKAILDKKFFIYALETIDEAITLLTGKTAGIRNKQGKFPANSINGLVEKRLGEYADRRMRLRAKRSRR